MGKERDGPHEPWTDPRLAARMELAAAWRAIRYARARAQLCPDVESAVEAIGEGYAVYAGAGAPVNRAVGLGMGSAVLDADLNRVESFYHARGEPPRVDLCPHADPSLSVLLDRHGYRRESALHILVRGTSDDLGPPIAAPGIEVCPVQVGEIDRWLEVVAQGFGGQEVPPQEVLDILAPNAHAETALLFWAWIGGEPAGGGAIVTHEGVAELCSDSTRPAFRRRGAHAALILARLSAARGAGCDLAVMITSPGSASQRSAERFGFRVAYTRTMMVGEQV